MIIGLVGDLEGDRAWAVDVLRSFRRRGDVEVVCQLGDLRFGMGEDPVGYQAAIEAACAEHGLRLLCVNGNHESWARLDALWAEPSWRDAAGGHRSIEVSDHVTLLPREHRGGWVVARSSARRAPSMNRQRLSEGVGWWPTEVIRDEQVESTVASGHAEVMLTHDGPAPPYCTEPVAEIVTGSPWGWPEQILAEARDGVDKVTRAVLGVRPRLLAQGHFHVAGEATVRLPGAPHETTVWSLAANRDPVNVRLLDLDTLREPTAPAR